MARILFIYSTVDGHTLEICQRLQSIAEQAGHSPTLHELTPASMPDLSGYDRIVIGASIRYGKHRPEVTDLINQNLAILEAQPSAFFSVNVVARKPDKRDPDTNPYVRKFLSRISWKPAIVAIFAGKIDYPAYGFFDRTMIRFIMWMTKGPTDPKTTIDFTDWNDVKRFGERIASQDL
ncbi:MAG: menaquinone-dependent protoporphyrinogen IX dehydrogenase [Gammaproteobacteria bacterium]|nr:menaquinone-dependent protoporphyrinogen IX dehydrogenase [Gammaproteobacteria bacterium]MDH4315457.1 menaquinone-dependent protoporphyrinogen IX dehydrogenase [Gammaproteobacteria bacterium]MDH5214284.1 menaquinone-dependent protoporphyrinogen IX dehydrogenase [Gammaproteobacteria bacterium]MDH5500880.1 menaquinone-dependent protoporphyrinogen IX dehydrogenase [Gammaproteobacteria bacterium]